MEHINSTLQIQFDELYIRKFLFLPFFFIFFFGKCAIPSESCGSYLHVLTYQACAHAHYIQCKIVWKPIRSIAENAYNSRNAETIEEYHIEFEERMATYREKQFNCSRMFVTVIM